MKKVFLLIIGIMFYFSSIAFAYVMGGTNLGIMGYPAFDEFISYNPTADDVNEYVRKAKEYVENGNNDINRIRDEQTEAIQKANSAVRSYNNSH